LTVFVDSKAFELDCNAGTSTNSDRIAGAGEQYGVSIALDVNGGLHLLWIERAEPNAPSRLWYSRALPR